MCMIYVRRSHVHRIRSLASLGVAKPYQLILEVLFKSHAHIIWNRLICKQGSTSFLTSVRLGTICLLVSNGQVHPKTNSPASCLSLNLSHSWDVSLSACWCREPLCIYPPKYVEAGTYVFHYLKILWVWESCCNCHSRKSPIHHICFQPIYMCCK
jgi:hypothetical protein